MRYCNTWLRPYLPTANDKMPGVRMSRGSRGRQTRVPCTDPEQDSNITLPRSTGKIWKGRICRDFCSQNVQRSFDNVHNWSWTLLLPQSAIQHGPTATSILASSSILSMYTLLPNDPIASATASTRSGVYTNMRPHPLDSSTAYRHVKPVNSWDPKLRETFHDSKVPTLSHIRLLYRWQANPHPEKQWF